MQYLWQQPTQHTSLVAAANPWVDPTPTPHTHNDSWLPGRGAAVVSCQTQACTRYQMTAW